MKKRLSIMAAVMIAALNITACSGTTAASTDAKTEEVKTEAVKTEAAKSESGKPESPAAADKESSTTKAASGEYSADTAETVITYNETCAEDHSMSRAAVYFRDLVAEATEGRIWIDLYFSGTLGGEASCMEGLQIGTIDMYRGNMSTLPDYGVSITNAVCLPYLFSDISELHSVLTSDVGNGLLQSIEDAGVGYVGLGYMEEGPRNLFLTEKAVKSLDLSNGLKLNDMAGLKVRVPETQSLIDAITALGASPTTIAYSELYTSLQTGVVDAAENGISGYVVNSFYEVAPYYVKDAHTFGPGVTLISEACWSKLSPEDQQIMKEAAAKTTEYAYELAVESENELYEKLPEMGVTVVEVEDISQWQEAVKDMYADSGEEIYSIVQEIQNMKK